MTEYIHDAWWQTAVAKAAGSGGGMYVRYEHPNIERIFPRTDWIKARQRFGGKVYRRTVIVVDDWEEVPRVDCEADHAL